MVKIFNKLLLLCKLLYELYLLRCIEATFSLQNFDVATTLMLNYANQKRSLGGTGGAAWY